MRRRRRRPRRGHAPAFLLVVALASGLGMAAAACSLTGLDTDTDSGDGALGSPDASIADTSRPDADSARADASVEPEDAAADAPDAAAEADSNGGAEVCPSVEACVAVCDDSPRHAVPTLHCADAGPLMSGDFYGCGTSNDCVKGSLCVDEGFCKPTCTKSTQCADNDAAASYGATSCNTVALDAGVIDP